MVWWISFKSQNACMVNAIIKEILRNKTVCCYFIRLNDMVIWKILIILLIAIFIGICSVMKYLANQTESLMSSSHKKTKFISIQLHKSFMFRERHVRSI